MSSEAFIAKLDAIEARLIALESRLKIFPCREIVAQTEFRIIKLVADHFGLTITQLLSSDRRDIIAWPRMLAMHLCREHLRLPTYRIGKAFGRDHSTVLHASKAVADRTSTDPRAAEQLAFLQSNLRAPAALRETKSASLR